MTAEFLSVFVTAPSYGEAEKIARSVVTENLAACANILSGAQSIYRWRGKVEQAAECVIFIKCAATQFDALQARIRDLHSYECPCIVATPIVAGNADYLNWLRGV
ncbi:MAG: divalent-cation tolerance protein CutA [Alphaproteobacteria bacterium]|nr:divalent-cation tolerance protein CutA [Alphaproteobacteria bacterium]